MKSVIHSNVAPAPIGPYSQAVKAGAFLFCSGQIAINAADGSMVLTGIAAETKQVMQNIKALLDEAGYTFNDIVKTTIFLKSMSQFAEVNAVYGSYFETNFPARETVEVSRLPKDVNVEISVTAYKA